MNRITLSGRLTDKIEVREYDDNTLAVFRIAVQQTFKNKKTDNYEADFFTCICFSNLAEHIKGIVKDKKRKCQVIKGARILIDGELRNNNYTDEDGVIHYGDQIIVNRIEFLERYVTDSNPSNKK